MRLVLVSAATTALLAGCATSYGEMGLSGGVAAERISADTFRIKSRANAFTDKTVAADYAMLGAAEAMQAACMTHFVVVGSDNRTSASTWVSPASSTSTWSGNRLHSTYTPSTSMTFVNPGVDLYVRGFQAQPGMPMPQNAMSVQDIITYTGARVKRSERAAVAAPGCTPTPPTTAQTAIAPPAHAVLLQTTPPQAGSLANVGPRRPAAAPPAADVWRDVNGQWEPVVPSRFQ